MSGNTTSVVTSRQAPGSGRRTSEPEAFQVEFLLQALKASTNGNGLASSAVDAAIRQCASKLLQEALELEVERYLNQIRHSDRWQAAPPVVRNGHHPDREFITSVGPVSIRIPKLRGRNPGAGMAPFESTLLPRYQRRARVDCAGPQWQFLNAFARCDWPALFTGLLGLHGSGVKHLARAMSCWDWAPNRVFQMPQSLALHKWRSLRTKAFAAPADYRLRESADEARDKSTLLAIAAENAPGQWHLVGCLVTDRISSEVWQDAATALAARRFELLRES